MRAVRMSNTSVYKDKHCLHCHKDVRNGDVAMVSTYYVQVASPHLVSTQANRFAGWSGWDEDDLPSEVQMRVVYHRRCLDKILAKAPSDREIEIAAFEEYRESLLERFGADE